MPDPNAEPLVVPERWREVYEYVGLILAGKRDLYPGSLNGYIQPLIEKLGRAERERDRYKADASWAATHRSELADLRDAFAKAEAELASLRTRLEAATGPVTIEEFHAYVNQDTYEFSEDEVNALLASRGGKTEAENGKS